MRVLLLVGWAVGLAAITVVSLLPQAAIGAAAGDKLKHFAAYGLLSILTWAAFKMRFGGRMLAVASALVIYGLGIELLQPFAGRTLSVGDAVANALGVVVGIGIWRLATILRSGGYGPRQ